MSRKDELYHYGVKGMKWGKRKAIKDYLAAKKSTGAGGSMSGDLKEKKNKPLSTGYGGKFTNDNPIYPIRNLKEDEADAKTLALKNIPTLSSRRLAQNKESFDKIKKRMDFQVRNYDRLKRGESRDLYRSRNQAPTRESKSFTKRAKAFINKISNKFSGIKENVGRTVSSKRKSRRRKRDESRSLYRSGNK